MYGKKRSVLLTFVLVLCLTSLVASTKPTVEGKVESFFTLVFKTNSGGVYPDYGSLIKQYCARIGINIDVIIQDWPTFVGELIAFRNFDLCYVAITGGGNDPDFSGVYDENGSLNLFGYHTDMDYEPKLGTGKNEWYIQQGKQIMPPHSEERVAHYWEWEQYLMDKILPCQPTFVTKEYEAYWSNLQGYDYNKGLMQSWGKMNWSGYHFGQIANNEVVLSMDQWSDLNPRFQDDDASEFVTNAITDSLFWFDDDLSAWPHLAKSWTHINDTYARITLREGIKWQTDPEGNFTDEYFDAEDVYFTIYEWKYACCDSQPFDWLEEMRIVDKYTIDFFIDGDRRTPENEPYAPYMDALNQRILPEHFLNQTQDPAGDPDVTHASWFTYATHCFGTGLFELDTFTEDIETTLTVFPDCWQLNSTITNDPDLNWLQRFGDFTGNLDQLRIRHFGDFYRTLAEFEQGYVDIAPIGDDYTIREQFEINSDITVKSKFETYFGFIGYNMRPVRPVIGSYDPCYRDPTMSKGLAIRKAISYAIDRNEMNQLIHNGEYEITDYPIYITTGVWCNPNITRYNHDLDKAREYMEKVGVILSYTIPTSINYYPLFILSEVLLYAAYILSKKRDRN
ncbi:MAG: ABC transporter substrate-binding protein [Candidatus Heimdallarchaeota archaeon]